MQQRKRLNFLRPARVVVALAAVAALIGLWQGTATAHGNVTAVTGNAFGYWSDNISLFGGAQSDFGPTPTVSLPAGGSSGVNASATCGYVHYQVATLLTSDAIAVNTSGTLGSTGAATTTSSMANINKATTTNCGGSDLTVVTGSEIFTADSVSGSVTADGAGKTASVTVVNGTLDTHHQASSDCTPPLDTTPCGRPGEQHTHDLNNPDGVVTIPTNPPANYTVAGHLHLGSTTTDYFVLVFNEQTTNSDGSLTVTPVHEYFGYKLINGQITEDLPQTQGGSILHGHLYLGQVTAGATVQLVNSPPVANDDSYSTDFQTPKTVSAAQGVLANDSDPDGDTFTAGGATDPPHGSVTLSADGSFTYTPDNGFSGTDTFTYTTTDAHGATDTATVTFTVGAPPLADLSVGASGPTSLSISTRKVPSSGSYTFTVSNGGPGVASGTTLSVSTSGARVSFGAITPSSGTCSVSKGKTKIVTCSFGNVPVGGTPPTVTIVVNAPTKPGSMTIAGTVATSSNDTNSLNNSASVTTSYLRP